MGGCRCYFRECHVNSQKFPNIHFFRFPLKEAERFKKWRQYSLMERILEFPELRRLNTKICGRHFRPECFMNYKQNRLTPFAVPTIMRLSIDKALDFELDNKNGVLVDLEKPKLKHLLPPDDFECSLSLTNDKILIEKLNELQSGQVEYITDESDQFEEMNVVRPNIKRFKEKLEGKLVSNASSINKKCRILNTSTCTAGNDVKKFSTVVLASLDDEEIESNEINIVEAVEIEDTIKLINNDRELFLTNDSFNYDCDEDVEFLQIDKADEVLPGEFSVHDADLTALEIESHVCEQNRLLKEKYDELYAKYTSLENENEELKQNCEHIEEIKKNALELQVENDNLKKSLEDLNSTRVKLQKLSEEYKTLKVESLNTEALKSELLSRKEESKELKNLLETLKNDNSRKGHIELEIKNKELNGLIKKYKLSQKKFNGTVTELKEVQANLINLKNENNILTQNEDKLKQSIQIMEKNVDMKHTDLNALKIDFDNLQQKYSVLEQKYWKLQAIHDQEATISTSLEKNKDSNLTTPISAPIAASSLTKGQLFNGIKRYLCASMVTLLRMEMFGSSEREWKQDERQVAVDILRLSEIVYKYFTDEWRIRLPALRDARYWLTQTQQLLDDEEDL